MGNMRVLWSVTIIAAVIGLAAQPVWAWNQVEVRSYMAVMGAVHRGQWPVAASRVREGLQSSPDSALLNNLAGAVFLHRGELGAADAAWQRVLTREPDDGLAAYGRGLVNLAQGRLPEAERWAERAAVGGDMAVCMLVRLYAAHLRGSTGDPSLPLPDSVISARTGLAAAIALRRGDPSRALDLARTALRSHNGGRYAEPAGVLMTFDPQAPVRFSQQPMSGGPFPVGNGFEPDVDYLWRMLTLKPSRAALARLGSMAATAVKDLSSARSLLLLADAIEPGERFDPSVYAPSGREALAPLWSGPESRRVVALTFDDGPRHGPTERILRTLQEHGARATFFVVGRHAAASPALVAQMAQAGMEVANHSFTHPNLIRLDERAIQEELIRTSACIADATGIVPRYFRPPGGQVNDRVLGVAGAIGLRACMWTVNAEYSERIGPQAVVQHVLSQVRPGAVVLLHNGSKATLTALPELLAALKRRGYEFVTVSELAAYGT